MVSIITAIHNGLSMNKIFFRSLKKYSHHPFQLIVIDNNSTDGSAEFFEREGNVVIRNKQNYSYPYSQNQGIVIAKYNWLAFLNNDIIVAPQWDKHLIETAEKNSLDVLTSCGLEKTENEKVNQSLRRKWKRIKNFVGLLGNSEINLNRMHNLMYGNWEKFCAERFHKFQFQTVRGCVGHSVFMSRTGIEKVGLWDERIQAADWDLSMRVAKRSAEVGDIKPIHVALDVFHHHYIRLTVKSKPQPFADAHKIISIDEKWSKNEITKYMHAE